MIKLADFISVRPHLHRSVNLERDADSSAIDGYIPTGRALDTLERVANALHNPSSGRAWSITGPYGSGKSSFALFIDALLAPSEDAARRKAEGLLAERSPQLLERLSTGRRRLGADSSGFLRAVVTAQPEPVVLTLLRALDTGVQRLLPRGRPARWTAAIRNAMTEAAQGSLPTPRQLVEYLALACDRLPVLFVLDEFGKNLEYAATSDHDGDLFVLQEIAEHISGVNGLPAYLLTLQHLAFDEYALGASGPRQREWTKVQGRFEDVPFLDTPDQYARMVSVVLDHRAASLSIRRQIKDWGTLGAATCAELGLLPALRFDASLIADCYPLHPLTVAAMPELCARFGQHERTLFSFLASAEDKAVPAFLAQQSPNGAWLPAIMLDRLYDYFLDSTSPTIASSSEASRWFEIEERLRDAQGLDANDLRILKTIGVLNLVSAGGALRASPGAIAFALNAPDTSAMFVSDMRQRLEALEARGYITYREFADEYRVWQGTDFDFRTHISSARARVVGEDAAAMLERTHPLAPVVAGRHTQQTGVLRFFTCHWSEHGEVIAGAGDGGDGTLLYVLGGEAGAASSAEANATPVAIVTADDTARVRSAAVEVRALLDVLEHHSALGTDWVARRELQERAAQASARLQAAVAETFGDRNSTVRCEFVSGDGAQQLDWSMGRSRVVSTLCDTAYSASPIVRNEMIARTELTSQGARAQRVLIEAMIRHATIERLAIEGFGPERAIYEAVLAATELHRPTGEGYAYGRPNEASHFQDAWDALTDAFVSASETPLPVSAIFERLARPPFGIKQGLLPVLLTAGLIAHADDVAMYQDGTYLPTLTPEAVERLVKSPARFAIKSFGLSRSQRKVIAALMDGFGAPITPPPTNRRNWTVLVAASPMLSLVRDLPNYSLQTTTVTDRAVSVRRALVEAREPDTLLFTDLPRACDLPPIQSSITDAGAHEYVERLRLALREVVGAYAVLLERLTGDIREAFGAPAALDVRTDLRVRSQRLVGQVLDPRLRSLLWLASDTTLDDSDWVEAIAMNIADRPPRGWHDDDYVRFQTNLKELGATFARVEALHFESREVAAEGFAVRKVTVTSPDGFETTQVVWVDEEVLRQVDQIADTALAATLDRIGSRGGSALLAVLAERLAPRVQTKRYDDVLVRDAKLGG
jgi:hypothetical protein